MVRIDSELIGLLLILAKCHGPHFVHGLISRDFGKHKLYTRQWYCDRSSGLGLGGKQFRFSAYDLTKAKK